MAGVMWRGKVLNVRFSRFDGLVTNTALADGIRYAASTGADIISVSSGFTNGTPLQPAVQFAEALGSVIVAGMPNVGQSGFYPWKYPEVIAVSRIDPSGQAMQHPYYSLDTTGVVAPGARGERSDD